jgi:hypothetical protein
MNYNGEIDRIDEMRITARNLCASADRVQFFVQSADWEMVSIEYHRLKSIIGVMDIQVNLQYDSHD